MNLKIFCTKESKKNSIPTKELGDMVRTILPNLLGKQLYKHINLKIFIEPFKGGLCDSLDAYERKQRNFLILLGSKQSIKQQKLTIAHELIHLKQYARNELKQHNNTFVVFRNRKFNFRKNEKMPWKFPWEIEAYKYEKILVDCYQNIKLIRGIK